MKIKNIDSFLENAKILVISFAKGVFYPAAYLGAAAAVLGAGLLLTTVETISLADLNSRPSFQSEGQGIKSFSGKIARMGEFDTPTSSIITYGKLVGEWQALLPISSSPRGFSFIDNEMRISKDHDVCMVSSRQHGDQKMGFYDFSSAPYIAEKDKLDFYIQSHEGTHCGFHIDVGSIHEDDKSLRAYYLESVQETAADLGAILDYMRLTGKADLYSDVVKPFRIAHIEDLGHTTTAALEIILKDVNPESLKSASPADIPHLVNHLMAKHMLFPEVGYDVFNDSDMIDDELLEKISEQPAAIALIKEMSGRVELMRGKLQDEHAIELRQQIKQTLIAQVNAYEGLVPDELLNQTIENQNDLFLKFELHEMETGYFEPRTAKTNEGLTGRGLLDFYVNSR